jgi:hypothetical protein
VIDLFSQIGKGIGSNGGDQILFLLAKGEGFSQVTFLKGYGWVMQQHVTKLLVDNCRRKNLA